MSTTLTVERVDENPDGTTTLYGCDLNGQPIVVTLKAGVIPPRVCCATCDVPFKHGVCPSCGGLPDLPA